MRSKKRSDGGVHPLSAVLLDEAEAAAPLGLVAEPWQPTSRLAAERSRVEDAAATRTALLPRLGRDLTDSLEWERMESRVPQQFHAQSDLSSAWDG